MTITVLCALAGAVNFREAGDRAGELPAELLAAAGARSSPGSGMPDPPSAATIRRVVQDVDAAALIGLLLPSWDDGMAYRMRFSTGGDHRDGSKAVIR